jgi:hypothetical protein
MKLKRFIGWATGLAVITTLVFMSSPAWAETRQCEMWGVYACETSPIKANSRQHTLWFRVHAQACRSPADPCWDNPPRINCEVTDVDTHVIVARLTAIAGRSAHKTIEGLYGRYRLKCVQGNNIWGAGYGLIDNAE